MDRLHQREDKYIVQSKADERWLNVQETTKGARVPKDSRHIYNRERNKENPLNIHCQRRLTKEAKVYPPTPYTPALRNHENFSYGGGAKQGPRPRHNYHQAHFQPRFQEQQQHMDNRGEYQGQKRTQSFEYQMVHFMLEYKRILNLHEKRFYEHENFQANASVVQTNTNASLRNLETQVGQLALSLQNQSRNPFPCITKINPKDFKPTSFRGDNELQGNKKI